MRFIGYSVPIVGPNLLNHPVYKLWGSIYALPFSPTGQFVEIFFRKWDRKLY